MKPSGLPGILGLGRLIVLWDDNSITIDGAVDLSSSEDVKARYAATGWHVESCDGHDFADIARAIEAAKADPPAFSGRVPHNHRQGCPQQAGHVGTRTAPRLALTKLRRRAQSWAGLRQPFEIPADILAAWRAAGARGAARSNRLGSASLTKRLRCRRVHTPYEWRIARRDTGNAGLS